MPKQNPYKKTNYVNSSYVAPPTTYVSNNSIVDSDKSVFFAKVFSILLPLLSFVIGQVVQYVLYFTQGRVLLLDLVFVNVNIFVLVLSSVLSLISTIMVIRGAWMFADDDELGKCWTYSIVASILLSTLPIVTGFVGIVATGAMTYIINEGEDNFFPLVSAISAFVISQVIMWFTFAGTGYAVILSEIWNAIPSDDNSILIPLIISSVCGAVATAIMSFVGYEYMWDYEDEKAFWTNLAFSILILFVPAFTCFIALIYSFVIYGCQRRYGDYSGIKLIPIGYMLIAMISIALLSLSNIPIYFVLISSTVEIVLFFILFNGNSKLSNYGDDYHWVTIAFFTLLGAGILFLQVDSFERYFSQLDTLCDMTYFYQASINYYNGVVADTKTIVIIGYLAVTIAMIVLVIKGERNIASVTMPLAAVGAVPIFIMIANAFIKLPENVLTVYENLSLLGKLIRGVLMAIPSGIYMLGVSFISDMVD